MLKFSVLILALLSGTALLAMNTERILLFHFDPTHVSPAEAGEPRLREVQQDGLVLWVANPPPDEPTILYFHGNAGNLADRVSRFTLLINEGYGVVAVAYPGSSGSTGRQSSNEINRLAASIYLKLPEIIGSDSVILYGESIGCGVAAQLAAQAKTAPAGLILEAPYTSILDMGRVRYPRLAPYLHLLGDPWISRKWIAKRNTPLLVLHGSEDRVIPPEMGRALYELSPATDKTFYLGQGVGHTVSWQGKAFDVLFGFLAQH